MHIDHARALFARAQTPERAEGRATWQPPAVEELALLLPAFVVEAFIGRGGMGAVYRVRQPALDRVVALKLLPCTAEEDAEFAERFRTEARALAKLLRNCSRRWTASSETWHPARSGGVCY